MLKNKHIGNLQYNLFRLKNINEYVEYAFVSCILLFMSKYSIFINTY